MKWKKKGLIFKVKNNFPWMHSHASTPVADYVGSNIFRIYFSTRNKKNQSQTGYIEINISNPRKIINLSHKPVLKLGKLGAFDENGLMVTSLVNYENKKYLYYVGWGSFSTTPFHWAIGLAISKDNGKTFRKFSTGPLLDRNYVDPFFVTSPTVILENGLWRMYYSSALGWKTYEGKKIAPYNIRYAESKNGIDWVRKRKICIDFRFPNEYAIGRANVLKENKIYKMWYSYSTGNYRIGYAESEDGINWKRKDEKAGIKVSKSGWDSKSVEHSFVFKHKTTTYMLYTGNEFGKTGFGYAILDN